MNKTWGVLIGLAIITVLIMSGYEFYLSFSGQSGNFARPETPKISPDLGVAELDYIKSLEDNVLIKDEELDR